MSFFTKWSIKKKVSSFAWAVVLSGVVIFGIYFAERISVERVQKRTKAAHEVNFLLQVLETDYQRMAGALVNFIANPGEAHWAEKEKADRDAQAHFNALRKVAFDPKMESQLKLLETFDGEYLDPMDKKVANLAKAESMEKVLQFYLEQYVPLFQKVTLTLEEGQEITQRGLVELAAAEARYNRAGMMLIGISILMITFVGFLAAKGLGRMIALPLEAAIKRLETETTQTRQAAGKPRRRSRK